MKKRQGIFQKLILFVLLFWTSLLNAQQYPVQVTPVLLPPYSLRLGDYATTADNKLQLQLLMKDLMEPSHRIKIRFSLESGLNATTVAQNNSFVTGFREITLYPGTPVLLTNVDLRPLFQLENLTGINAVNYARPLPEGMYRFCFQVFDAGTGRALSAKSAAIAYLVQYEPPLLNLPQQGEKIVKPGEFQNIVFQWMPRQMAPNTRYIFTLKELWDNQRDPVSGFLSSRALWQEETHAPTLYYGMDKTALIPGRRYAWQVQAKSGNPVAGNSATEDNGVYKNNGLSEIFYFDYTENCAVPVMLTAKNAGRGKTEVRWSMTVNSSGGLYRIQYRRKGSTAEWAQQESYQAMCILTGLRDETEYEYRVGSVCGNLYQAGNTDNAYAFSEIQSFVTDSKKAANDNIQCGILPQADLSNKSPLQTPLGVNEVFMAGDFPVTVLQSQGSSGTYTGYGYIEVPYLADTKIKVTFNNIQLNTDKRLIAGMLETTYDVNESSLSHVSQSIGETFGDRGAEPVIVDYVISDIEYVATPPPGKIIITGNSGTGNSDDTGSGESSRQELPAGKDYAITDRDGNVWHVDEEGNITKGEKVAEGGASNTQNTEGVTGSGSNAQVSQYTAKGVKIQWYEMPETKYAYDTADKLPALKDKYPAVKDADGNTVYVPYKAVVNKQTDVFGAKITFTDEALKGQKVIFKTLKTGQEIAAQKGSDDDYTLTLKGTMNYAEEDVIAVLMPQDSTQKQQVIGSFKLVHLEPKEINATLVPTDEASKGKLQSIREETNAIYSKVGVTINFNEDDIFDITSYLGDNKDIPTEKNSLLSTYSSVQQAINKAYGNRNSNRYVLFVTDRKSSTGQMGYMRLGGQFGYIFGSAMEKTAAHELGHGVFKLEHPWEQYKTTEGATALLMDYSDGDVLTHLDWKQVNDPKLKFYEFQGQGEGELAGGYVFTPDYKLVKIANSSTLSVNTSYSLKVGTLPGFVIYENEGKDNQVSYFYFWDTEKRGYYDNKTGIEYQAIEEKNSLGRGEFIYLFYNLNKDCGGQGYITTKELSKLKAIIELNNKTESQQKLFTYISEIASHSGKAIPCGKSSDNTVPWTSDMQPPYDCYDTEAIELFKADIDAINNGFKANMTDKEVNQLLEKHANTCVFGHIKLNIRIQMLDILLQDNVDDELWEFSNEYSFGDYFYLDNLILSTPIDERVEFLKRGFFEDKTTSNGKTVKYLWLKTLWDESKNAIFDNDVDLPQYAGLLSSLTEWIMENYDSLPIEITKEISQISETESIELPAGFEPILLGKGGDDFKWTSRMIDETLNGNLEVTLGENNISFDLVGNTYKIHIGQTQYRKLTKDNGEVVNSITHYDKTFDPLEPVTLWIGHNYEFLQLRAEDRNNKIVIPALLAAALIQQIENDKTAYYVRMGGNTIAIVAAVAAAPYSGGGSLAAYAASLSVAGGVVAAGDMILQTYKQELKKDGENYATYQEAFEAWDNLYTAVMIADGAANIGLAVKNFSIAKALVRYRQAVNSLSHLNTKYANYFRQLLNEIRITSTGKNINSIDNLIDINQLKVLTAQTPTGNSLTRISKDMFDSFGLSIPKPIQGRIATLVDDIMKNGDLSGYKTEEIIDILMDAKGYQKINAKYHGVNGFDGCYIPKGQTLDDATEILITESKQFKQGLLEEFDDIARTNYDKTSGLVLNSPNSNTGLPTQMSDQWIEFVINKMLTSSDLNTKTLGLKIFTLYDDTPQIFTKYVNAVDKSTGEIWFMKLDNF